MRILMVTDAPPDPDSGVAGTEWQTAAAIRLLGHQVDALWERDLGPRRIRHGNLHYLLELPRAILAAVRARFDTQPYDVVHVNQPHGFLAAEWLAARHPEVPFVHRSHGLELRVERDLKPWRERFASDRRGVLRRAAAGVMAAALRRHTLRTVAAAAGHIVYVTQCRDFLVEELGVPATRIAVVPAAPPDAMIEAAVPPMSESRLRNVLHASQFAFFKAPMIAAGAMNGLAAEPDLRFAWLCDERHHDQVLALLTPEVRGRLQLHRWMEQAALRDVYDRAGVFLFPSFFEGFGKVFLEAMARGCIVIASDIAGARDVIEHGRTGFLVAPGDTAAIIAAAREITSDQPRAAEVSAAAARAARRYTWRRAAEASLSFYEHLIAEAAGRPATRRGSR